MPPHEKIVDHRVTFPPFQQGKLSTPLYHLRWSVATYSARAAAVQYVAPDVKGGIAIGTDGLLLEWTNNISGLVISESDGDIDVTLTETSTGTWYLVLVLPGGNLAVSGAITFV